MSDDITIPRHVYNSLQRDSLMLQALQSAGVDNWEGMDYAIELYDEDVADLGLNKEN